MQTKSLFVAANEKKNFGFHLPPAILGLKKQDFRTKGDPSFLLEIPESCRHSLSLCP